MATQTESFGITSESTTVGDIFAQGYPVVTESAVLAPGSGTLKHGTVLGKLSSGGKLVPYDADGTDDGRRTAYRILSGDAVLDDTDDTAALVYRTGVFRREKLTGIDDAGVVDLDAHHLFVR